MYLLHQVSLPEFSKKPASTQENLSYNLPNSIRWLKLAADRESLTINDWLNQGFRSC